MSFSLAVTGYANRKVRGVRRGYPQRARVFITACAGFQQRGMVLLRRSLQDLAHS